MACQAGGRRDAAAQPAGVLQHDQRSAQQPSVPGPRTDTAACPASPRRGGPAPAPPGPCAGGAPPGCAPAAAPPAAPAPPTGAAHAARARAARRRRGSTAGAAARAAALQQHGQQASSGRHTWVCRASVLQTPLRRAAVHAGGADSVANAQTAAQMPGSCRRHAARSRPASGPTAGPAGQRWRGRRRSPSGLQCSYSSTRPSASTAHTSAGRLTWRPPPASRRCVYSTSSATSSPTSCCSRLGGSRTGGGTAACCCCWPGSAAAAAAAASVGAVPGSCLAAALAMRCCRAGG